MKKKFFAYLAIILCLSTLLVSCGNAKTLKFDKVVNAENYPENATLNSAEKLNVEGDFTKATKELALFTKIGTTGNASYSLYNMELGKVVYTANVTESTVADGVTITTYDFTLANTNDVAWFYVTKTTVATKGTDVTTSQAITLYKADGTEFAKAESKNTAVHTIDIPKNVCDLIMFNDVCYRADDEGAIEKAFDFSELRTLPGIGMKVGDYYYGGFQNSDAIVAFDSELNMLASYTLPQYVDDYSAFVLNNGNIFIQLQTICNDNSEEYDYIDDEGVKYELTSLIIDVKTGKAKDIELDFIVNELTAQSQIKDSKTEPISDKIENYAVIHYIENERVDFEEDNAPRVSINNNMKVVGVLNGFTQGNFSYFRCVANGRYIVSNIEGQKFLLNGDGDVIGELTTHDAIYDNGIILNNKIYNWDLELVCNLNEQGAVSYEALNKCVVFTTFDGETKVFANGEVKTLISKDDTKAIEFLDDIGFIIVNTKDAKDFSIYNDTAKSIYTSDKNSSFTLGATIVAETEASAIVMLPLTKADGSSLNTYFIVK